MNESDELINKATKEALWHVDAELEKGGWDQPPQLWLAIKHPLGEGVNAVELKPMPGWDYVWSRLPNIQGALAVMLQSAKAYPKSLKPYTFPGIERLFGLVLAVEAWVLEVNKDDPDAEAKEEMAKAHTIHNHPDKVETRTIYLCPVDGQGAMLAHEREGVPRMIDDGDHRGEVPRLLKELNQALTT